MSATTCHHFNMLTEKKTILLFLFFDSNAFYMPSVLLRNLCSSLYDFFVEQQAAAVQRRA